MNTKTVSFDDGIREAEPKVVYVLLRLHELTGLIQAFNAIVFKAANSEEMRRDQIDWEAVGHLTDRAGVICYEAEQAAEILHERESPSLFPSRKGGPQADQVQ